MRLFVDIPSTAKITLLNFGSLCLCAVANIAAKLSIPLRKKRKKYLSEKKKKKIPLRKKKKKNTSQKKREKIPLRKKKKKHTSQKKKNTSRQNISTSDFMNLA